jgi:hypothetical protein
MEIVFETPQFHSISAQVITRDFSREHHTLPVKIHALNNMIPETPNEGHVDGT